MWGLKIVQSKRKVKIYAKSYNVQCIVGPIIQDEKKSQNTLIATMYNELRVPNIDQDQKLLNIYSNNLTKKWNKILYSVYRRTHQIKIYNIFFMGWFISRGIWQRYRQSFIFIHPEDVLFFNIFDISTYIYKFYLIRKVLLEEETRHYRYSVPHQ